jgi:hypothetical protein
MTDPMTATDAIPDLEVPAVKRRNQRPETAAASVPTPKANRKGKRGKAHPARAIPSTTKSTADGAVAVAEFDSSAILKEMQSLREAMESVRTENAGLRDRLEAAKQKATDFDEYGLKNDALAGIGVTNSGTDVPPTLEQKLNAMELMAQRQREPFDRDRVRKIILGESVEDLNAGKQCSVCGKVNDAWAVSEARKAHETSCTAAKSRAIARANAA